MNSKQRRKSKRHPKYIDAKEYKKYKNDQRCINARRDTRKSIPDFAHCGTGNGGYVQLVCNGCPAFENEKYT